MSRLYNEDIKEKFLETYDNEQTRKTLKNVFIKSQPIESVLNKDLYNFNIDELANVIHNTDPLSITVARSTGRFISQYINWALPYRNTNDNPLDGMSNEWYERFVDKSKKIHWSENEFYELVEKLDNAQDQAFLSLVFEGVLGKGSTELRLLHYNNVNWNANEITVTEEFEDKKETRTLKVSDRTMRYIENAYKQQTYRTYNSETGDYNERDLLESDYIFKNLKSPRAKAGVPVNQSVLYSRLSDIKEKYDLQYLTPNSIKQSGQLRMAVELYNRDGKLEYEQFAEIGERYRLSMLYNGGYSYFNTTLMKQYINSENLKELYDIDIQF